MALRVRVRLMSCVHVSLQARAEMLNEAPPWAQSSMGPMMRRRHAGGGAADVGNGGASREDTSIFARAIKRLDLYARIDDDLQVQTEAGAAVTIGFWVLMVVLCIGEVQAFRKVQPSTERVVVDSTMGQRLRINVDMVSERKHCPIARLHVIDQRLIVLSGVTYPADREKSVEIIGRFCFCFLLATAPVDEFRCPVALSFIIRCQGFIRSFGQSPTCRSFAVWVVGMRSA